MFNYSKQYWLFLAHFNVIKTNKHPKSNKSNGQVPSYEYSVLTTPEQYDQGHISHNI